MNTFKIGDKVKILSHGCKLNIRNQDYYNEIGLLLGIDNSDEYPYYIKISRSIGYNYIFVKEVELINTEIKVNDIVKVIKNQNFVIIPIGTQCKVLKTDFDDNNFSLLYYVQSLKDNSLFDWVEDVELYEADTINKEDVIISSNYNIAGTIDILDNSVIFDESDPFPHYKWQQNLYKISVDEYNKKLSDWKLKGAEAIKRGTEIHQQIENQLNGYKESEGKIYYDLDWQLIQDLGELLFSNKVENGGKYNRENWKKDLNIKDLEDSLERHFMKYKLGLVDEEHDLSIVANIMMLRYLKRLRNIKK